MTKRCATCGLTLPVSEFHRRGRNNASPQSACKACSRERTRKSRAENPERSAQREWRARNRDRIRQQQREWYERNKERAKANNAAWSRIRLATSARARVLPRELR